MSLFDQLLSNLVVTEIIWIKMSLAKRKKNCMKHMQQLQITFLAGNTISSSFDPKGFLRRACSQNHYFMPASGGHARISAWVVWVSEIKTRTDSGCQ